MFLYFSTVQTYASVVSASNPGFTANLMAPLKVTDFGAFHYELLLARDMGAEAITVDVWWGDVEGVADNQFDWSYYDKVFSMIRDAGLKIKPIMSFHQAGGNVGDTYYSFLPAWLWTQYAGRYFNGRILTKRDLKYVSELGNASKEFLSLWVTELVKHQYIDFMNAFEAHFGALRNYFTEINISA